MPACAGSEQASQTTTEPATERTVRAGCGKPRRSDLMSTYREGARKKAWNAM